MLQETSREVPGSAGETQGQAAAVDQHSVEEIGEAIEDLAIEDLVIEGQTEGLTEGQALVLRLCRNQSLSMVHPWTGHPGISGGSFL